MSFCTGLYVLFGNKKSQKYHDVSIIKICPLKNLVNLKGVPEDITRGKQSGERFINPNC